MSSRRRPVNGLKASVFALAVAARSLRSSMRGAAASATRAAFARGAAAAEPLAETARADAAFVACGDGAVLTCLRPALRRGAARAADARALTCLLIDVSCAGSHAPGS